MVVELNIKVSATTIPLYMALCQYIESTAQEPTNEAEEECTTGGGFDGIHYPIVLISLLKVFQFRDKQAIDYRVPTRGEI